MYSNDEFSQRRRRKVKRTTARWDAAAVINIDELFLKNMLNYVLKTMNSVSKMMNFALHTGVLDEIGGASDGEEYDFEDDFEDV